jgi:hypothetical protein
MAVMIIEEIITVGGTTITAGIVAEADGGITTVAAVTARGITIVIADRSAAGPE